MLFPLRPSANPPPRIVITGAGIITALGLGWTANARGFRLGRSAIRPVTLFDTTRQRAHQAAEVDLPPEPPPLPFSARHTRRRDRATLMLLHAAHEALTQSRWTPDPLPSLPSPNPPLATPIVLGTTSGGMTLGQDFFRTALNPPRHRHQQPTRLIHYQAQRQAQDLAEASQLRGPITIIANACASGANAIGHAWELLRSGAAERALAGGYDALCQLVFSGFDSLQALSTTTCRPFDATRDGLALGEGAALLCLETLDHARQRHAPILGEIVGYGATTDSHHLTQPHPQGDAALAAMTQATQRAHLLPENIGYLNAHGTGTPLNDAAEAAAINRWAGLHAPNLPVSSTKAAIGHTLGAAGAIETLVTLMTLHEHWLPPNARPHTPDPACQFHLVTQPQASTHTYALTNSFGFGGANATLILHHEPNDHPHPFSPPTNH